MNRVTVDDLNKMVSTLNIDKNKGAFNVPYNAPGRYDLDFAYGGVKLVQYCDGGGQRDISTIGFGTKRELYNFIRGMLAGKSA